ncbi:hypothetical protein JHD49_06755 [Sulfurimonas sp. SAG-AH-194-C21]|nr:hypothetical protein [Sulfurimonas sp. SAG-AH-194-C21]MDF1883634.1 hypothetical protein [Sulfurimonas sp. SAG-AH-194-C21]
MSYLILLIIFFSTLTAQGTNKSISSKYPIIVVLDSGLHAKKVISTIETSLSNSQVTDISKNIIFVSRDFSSKNERSDSEVITNIAKRFPQQKVFVNISYGYKLVLPSKYVSYTQNPFFRKDLRMLLNTYKQITEDFIKSIAKLNNVSVYKSYGNYIYFEDTLLARNYSTKEALSLIYNHICGSDYGKKLLLSHYIREYLYTYKTIDLVKIKTYIQKNISKKSLDENVLKNLLRYSEVELYAQYVNNMYIDKKNIKLVEAINYDSIYSGYKNSTKIYPEELKNDLDGVYIEYIKSESLNLVRFNFSYISKVSQFIKKYQSIYPELFISVYENYSSLDINHKNTLAPQGQALKLNYSTLDELLKDTQRRFIGTSSATPEALADGVKKEVL